MSAGQDDRVRSVFQEACGLTHEGRRDLLNRLRVDEPGMVSEVESLLSHHDRSDAILDRTPASSIGSGAGTPAGPPEGIRLPAPFGSYTLVRVLGEGGMGVVYEAEQASPRRRVALKLVRPEAVSASVLRRFEIEIEALGLLDHPGIARVYEAGRADLLGQSRAYVAMELVEGESLTEHARTKRMTARDRIKLMADICDAVQFAHRRGVIHRDLKPANIHVAADGAFRILDFGVARLSTDRSGGGTLVTRAGQIVGTLAYMSPEQARGNPAETDTRSDVYSLGAILFELLTGRPPIEVTGLSLHTALERLGSEEPRVPRTIRESLGRDAEAVLLRALEKDPARRYQHASELAADLRAYLGGEPVSARTPTPLYRVARFCRRNKELTGAAVLIGATALVAIVVISQALSRERSARAAADRHAAEAEGSRDEAVASAAAARTNLKRFEAVTGFLRSILAGIKPEVARGKDTTLLREILQNAEATLPELNAQPAAQGDATGMLAEVYRSLGDFETSERYSVRTIEQYTRAFGERDKRTASAIHNLGALYRGSLRRYDDAEPLLRKAAELFLAIGGPENLDYRRAQNSLALLLMDMGKYSEAEPVLREILDHERRAGGADAPSTLRAMHNYAGALSMTGRVHEALRLAEQAYERRSATLGEDNAETVNSLLFYANTLRVCGRAAESMPLIERVVEARSSRQGPRHQLTLSARGSLANTLLDLGRLEEAEAEAADALAGLVAAVGAAHVDAIQLRLTVLEAQVMLGKCERTLEEAGAILGAARGLGPRYAMWESVAEVHRGMAMACVGDLGAEEAIRKGYAALEATLGSGNRLTRRAAESMAWFHRRAGREGDAANWDRRAAVPPATGK